MTSSGSTNDEHASSGERQKEAAAEAALSQVASGMVLGLGTGSTARFVTLGIGARLARGDLTDVVGVPTSEATRELAEGAGVPLIELPAAGVDLAIDGMDEVDPNLDAIKGLGGALLREKIVAASARTFVLVGDVSKPVERLGAQAPVPVEILRFGADRTLARLNALDLDVRLRMEGADPFQTDNGHWIVDARFDPSRNARDLARAIRRIPGVLEHGFFFDLATTAYVATPDGVRTMHRPEAS